MFKSIRRRRISDEVVHQITEALFSGKLQPGDRLPRERDLADTFGASRTSVREPLRSLEQEGLIQVKKGSKGGLFVAELDHGPVTRSLHTLLRVGKVTLENIAEVRLIFEPEAA